LSVEFGQTVSLALITALGNGFTAKIALLVTASHEPLTSTPVSPVIRRRHVGQNQRVAVLPGQHRAVLSPHKTKWATAGNHRGKLAVVPAQLVKLVSAVAVTLVLLTVTVNAQVLLLPHASVAVLVTVVTPAGKESHSVARWSRCPARSCRSLSP
jgi:hypothetical protein